MIIIARAGDSEMQVGCASKHANRSDQIDAAP